MFLIRRALEKDGLLSNMKWVDTREEFEATLNNFKPDVVLSDHALPRFNSLEALSICQQMRLSVPFLLISGKITDELAVIYLNQGIDDYVLKGNLPRLPMAIKKALVHRQTERQKQKIERSLYFQNEQLRKANLELDKFVYSVSHNLRGPLATIEGLLKLSGIDQNTPQYNYSTALQNSVNALKQTISQILDYARNTRLPTANVKVAMNELVARVIQEFAYLPELEHIEINYSEKEEITVHTDEYRLMVILKNVLANAIQYLDKTPGKINIIGTQSEGWATVSIRDNGMGIDPAIRPEIFNMFFRGTEISQGAGLGLYVAQETIGKLGGRIEIDSKLDHGTCVTIVIPDNPGL